MSGPSGVDAPAPDNPSMISDPFRAFSAASQGARERARRLVRDMSHEDRASLDRVVVMLADALDRHYHGRLSVADDPEPRSAPPR